MNYSKPEVKTLGQAKMVIEGGKGQFSLTDAPVHKVIQPAYDLDE